MMTADFGTLPYSCDRCGYIVDVNASEQVPRPSCLIDTLSKSNNPPPSSHLSPLEMERAELTPILAVLDSQTAELRASMEIFEAKKRQVEARLWAYKSAVHPIRRMPDELLAAIFTLCTDEDTRIQRKGPSGLIYDSLSMLDFKGCPWTLSQFLARFNLGYHAPDFCPPSFSHPHISLFTRINCGSIELNNIAHAASTNDQSCRIRPLNILALNGVDDEPLIELLNIPEIRHLRTLSIGGLWSSEMRHYQGTSDTVLKQFQSVETEPHSIQAIKGPRVLLPYIEELFLTGPRRWTEKTLVNVLSSCRNVDWTQASRLRKITLQMGDDDSNLEDESPADMLKKFIAEGLVARG
ncbi:hypothetical protein PQX77_012127 [Marasmius sp. AFHP31]|nr:hypothetical protein PQX77_012127 [Marasmius sp. AFHP31]